jgi:hypothetical protein
MAESSRQRHQTQASEWLYEPADPSVGYMSEGWVHEDCPTPNAEGSCAFTQERDGFDLTITCEDCGGYLLLQGNDPS